MRTSMTCLLAILAFALPAAAGEMKLGEIAPAAPVQGQNQFSPDVACGQGQYLAVWQRSRNEPGRIECARLDATGKPLDTKPVVLAPDAEWQEAPRVAFGGNMYLVVWYDLRGGKEFDVFAARVTPEGKVLDVGGIPVSKTPAGSSRFPAVAFDGKDFIVVWSQLEDGNKDNFRLFAARVGLDGRASSPQPLDIQYRKVPIGPQRQDFLEADLTVSGGRLLVTCGVWGGFAQIFSLPELKPAGPKDGLLPSAKGATRRATSATDGKGFIFSVWCGDGHVSGNGGIIQLLTADGKASPMAPFWCGGKLGLLAPALAFDGGNYLFARQRWSNENKAYGTNSHLCARLISTDGKPQGAADLDVAGTTAGQLNTLPRLASDGKGHVLMVWEQHPTTGDGNVVAATRLITTR